MDIGSLDAYGEDVGILWAAYQAGSFPYEKDLSQEEFADLLMFNLSSYDSLFMSEDNSKEFSSGRGPVAIWGIKAVADIIQPEVIHFKWASKRNILRVVVSFFQMIRYSKNVGMCVFRSTEEAKNMYQKLSEYGLDVRSIGNGFFCIAGRKSWHG